MRTFTSRWGHAQYALKKLEDPNLAGRINWPKFSESRGRAVRRAGGYHPLKFSSYSLTIPVMINWQRVAIIVFKRWIASFLPGKVPPLLTP
jgi:hypothetical protein